MMEGNGPALESLVNQIAHDVRNHAFAIGLQSEMGQRRTAALPEIKTHFDAILRQVDALRHYLDELLLFGRPVKLTVVGVDPVALVREQVQRLQFGRDAASTLDIRVEAPEPLRQARWDHRALAHAVQALLDNAIRSAEPPPPVVVTVRAADGGATIEVHDGGPGIPAEVLAKLAVPMAVRRAGGAGLGLAIARKMAEAHGGRLDLESGSGGTTARLVLPWEAVPA